jgi:hypothetical protein
LSAFGPFCLIAKERFDSPVLRGHALHTCTNTNFNHTRLDRVGNIHNGLETTGALSVQALDSSRLGEPGNEGGGTELGSTATRGKDGANSNIFHNLGVDATAVDDALEDTGQQISGSGILETTFATLGQGSTQGTCDNDIIGMLLGDGGDTLLASRCEVGGNLRKTLLSCESPT